MTTPQLVGLALPSTNPPNSLNPSAAPASVLYLLYISPNRFLLLPRPFNLFPITWCLIMASNGHTASPEELAKRNYIRWDAEGVEKIPPNEAEDIQAVADMINEIQRAHWNNARHCYSGTHARTQGIVKGKFIVSDDLPKHLKQSELFEKGGEYPVACRYSSEPGDPGLDVSLPLSSCPESPQH